MSLTFGAATPVRAAAGRHDQVSRLGLVKGFSNWQEAHRAAKDERVLAIGFVEPKRARGHGHAQAVGIVPRAQDRPFQDAARGKGVRRLRSCFDGRGAEEGRGGEHGFGP